MGIKSSFWGNKIQNDFIFNLKFFFNWGNFTPFLNSEISNLQTGTLSVITLITLSKESKKLLVNKEQMPISSKNI